MNAFKTLEVLLVMLLVSCLTGFSSDIYTPSFLSMASSFATSIEEVQRSMGLFMLAVSLSQLIYGPASEIVGRRRPLMIGLIIMFLGSLLCFYANTIEMLFAGRFIQGLGAGACACLWRAIFRDVFTSQQLIKYGGYIGIVLVFIVAAAPALGGFLEQAFGWRADFLAIIFYTILTLLLVQFVLKETSLHHHRDRLKFSFFKEAFAQLLSSPIFMGYSACVFLTYGAFFSWFVMGPVLLIDNLGISPSTFGLLNLGVGGSAMTLGGLFNGKMIAKLGKITMLRLGWSLIGLSGIAIWMINAFYEQHLLGLLIPIFVFLFGVTLIWPSSFAGAFAPFGKIAGCAAALYSCIQLGGGAIIGWLSSFLPTKTPTPFSMVLILSAASAWIIFEKVIKKKEP